MTYFQTKKLALLGQNCSFWTAKESNHAGGELEYPLAVSRHLAYGEIDKGQADSRREVPYVTGASLAIRWTLAEDLGLFDERFSPYYFEETDLCYRVRAAGFKVVYIPEAVALHHETFSAVKHSAQSAPTAYHINRLRMVLKHYSDDQLLNDFIPAESSRLQTTPDVGRRVRSNSASLPGNNDGAIIHQRHFSPKIEPCWPH